MLYLLPVVIVAIITITHAVRSKEELYTVPAEGYRGNNRFRFKGILKYLGIFLLTNTGIYLFIILLPIIFVGALLSSITFCVFFRI